VTSALRCASRLRRGLQWSCHPPRGAAMRTPALLLVTLLAAPAAAQDDGTKVYKRVVRSVVWVHSPRDRGLAMGSGTLIDLDRRLILTNYHVVETENRARVF